MAATEESACFRVREELGGVQPGAGMLDLDVETPPSGSTGQHAACAVEVTRERRVGHAQAFGRPANRSGANDGEKPDHVTSGLEHGPELKDGVDTIRARPNGWGFAVLARQSTRKTDASPSGADLLARRRSSAKAVQVANQDMRQTGRRDSSEQGFCDPGESDHEGCSPISALLRGHRQSTTQSCSLTDYAPSARSLSPVGSCRPEELAGEQDWCPSGKLEKTACWKGAFGAP